MSGEDSDEQFGGSDFSVGDTSLVDEPSANAEYFEEPVKKDKKKGKGDTCALILLKRGVIPKKGDIDDQDVVMGETEDVTST